MLKYKQQKDQLIKDIQWKDYHDMYLGTTEITEV